MEYYQCRSHCARAIMMWKTAGRSVECPFEAVSNDDVLGILNVDPAVATPGPTAADLLAIDRNPLKNNVIATLGDQERFYKSLAVIFRIAINLGVFWRRTRPWDTRFYNNRGDAHAAEELLVGRLSLACWL